MLRDFVAIVALLSFMACVDEGKPSLRGVFDHDEDMAVHYDLNDIQSEGELIVLTLYGPDSYFEFRGEESYFPTNLLGLFHHAASVEQGITFVGTYQSAQHAQCRGLAGAVGA